MSVEVDEGMKLPSLPLVMRRRWGESLERVERVVYRVFVGEVEGTVISSGSFLGG